MPGTAKKRRKKCRHCKERLQTRPRGLCLHCFRHLPTRNLYPPKSKFAQRGPGADKNYRTRKPRRPTKEIPGTEEKMLVMEKRLARGESLFHDLDPSLAGRIPADVQRGIFVMPGHRIEDFESDSLIDGTKGGDQFA